MSKYTDDQIFEKLKEILGICCPDLSIDTVTKDTVINRDNGIDSLNFIMIMSKVEAAFDIRVPDADWDRLSTAQDVIDKVQEQLALKA
ncbi:MAG: acyl carrier protein [Lachnospiraceae bacterium]|jgi:acyl carrier protein|nr:acyl carrier protein [Lachnospiraceae bacterium]MDD5956991.1 acyl carrier protein [Lachnospiraceae bacterium]MDY3991623.1 acyl carrier protein [Lachnospiraceae bacterium]